MKIKGRTFVICGPQSWVLPTSYICWLARRLSVLLCHLRPRQGEKYLGGLSSPCWASIHRIWAGAKDPDKLKHFFGNIFLLGFQSQTRVDALPKCNHYHCPASQPQEFSSPALVRLLQKWATFKFRQVVPVLIAQWTCHTPGGVSSMSRKSVIFFYMPVTWHEYLCVF